MPGPQDSFVAAYLAESVATMSAFAADADAARTMLAMGAELGHSQQGNNNAYCQDGPLSWLDWAAADRGLLATASALTRVRLAHPALHDDHFLTGVAAEPGQTPDAAWFGADGRAMTPDAWNDPDAATLVAVLTGHPHALEHA